MNATEEREMLSAHFSADEFRCPLSKAVRVSPRLIEALESLRVLAGNVPISIVRFGGCRSRRANKIAGGTKLSQHLIEDPKTGKAIDCQAADVVVSGKTPAEVVALALEVEAFKNGGIGFYPEEGFCHLDVRPHRSRWARMRRGDPYVAMPAGME